MDKGNATPIVTYVRQTIQAGDKAEDTYNLDIQMDC
jgi:hypothetical protein